MELRQKHLFKRIGITGKDGKDFTEFVPTSTLGYNPQEAKKLLAEGLKEAGQASFPKMSMLINESGNNKVIAEYIQEQLRKNLNIQLDLEIMTAQERFSRMSQRTLIWYLLDGLEIILMQLHI